MAMPRELLPKLPRKPREDIHLAAKQINRTGKTDDRAMARKTKLARLRSKLLLGALEPVQFL
eukprot:CAMPEP_0197645986 /NCGR_PEP_ID=MMETSP1338-20131121/21374_1 /TAXON_ID=43686 ORGANISM="Pelagodinium beii, Strain RCC1491" /NCGR_SAMPLE_ID=MMETSP1338 /ASSEMBLY_ACC=CAM_ASM_000754 /LENGTH=61 /DNA_ID=CAMNT_0043219565 /DNA_START=1 /DNA_END=183 /DNA_ORIENTATION=-